jgi:hypothetical protein
MTAPLLFGMMCSTCGGKQPVHPLTPDQAEVNAFKAIQVDQERLDKYVTSACKALRKAEDKKSFKHWKRAAAKMEKAERLQGEAIQWENGESAKSVCSP